ncbi:MAG: hypothetical protein P1U36_09345 [Legionellaceae bacterium]|nr:hypothetical protein [Legionellaceae bacterium]
MTSKETSTHDQQFFSEIRELLQTGREVAYRSVNSVMVNTYWQIDR